MVARRLRLLSLLSAGLWAALIFYLSNQSDPGFHPTFPQQDKLMHFAAFAILGFLGMGSVHATAQGYRPAQAWRVSLLAGLYGISDEVHQYFIPGRMTEVLDATADLAGAACGAWVLYWLVRLAARRRTAAAD